jgi:hypothetical protein
VSHSLSRAEIGWLTGPREVHALWQCTCRSRGVAVTQASHQAILSTCWSYDQTANAATGTSIRRLRMSSSAPMSAPGAVRALSGSCTVCARTVAGNLSGVQLGPPTCWRSIRRRPSGWSGPIAPRHLWADSDGLMIEWSWGNASDALMRNVVAVNGISPERDPVPAREAGLAT